MKSEISLNQSGFKFQFIKKYWSNRVKDSELQNSVSVLSTQLCNHYLVFSMIIILLHFNINKCNIKYATRDWPKLLNYRLLSQYY